VGLFHITTRDAWARAQAAGEYRAPSLDTAGFIHLSSDRQWLDTANRLFHGQRGLVLLSISAERLTARVVWEPGVPATPDGQKFPHLYGPLALAAVVEALDLPVDATGAIGIPAELAPWRHYFEPLRRVVWPAPEALARMRAVDPLLGDQAVCVVRDHGGFVVYACYGEVPGADRTLRHGALIRAAAELPPELRPFRVPNPCGSLICGPFPRRADGSVDEPALLDYIERLVAAD